MRTLPFVALVIGAATSATVFAADKDSQQTLDTGKDKFSYAAGFQIGQRLKSNGLDVNPAVFARAIQDVLAGNQPQMSLQEMQTALEQYRQNAISERTETAEKNRKAGEQFLEENSNQEGVVVLPSGLQYKVIEEGSGKMPEADDTVVVHYRGTLLNGNVFDSSYERGEPTTFKVNAVIPGWQEALQNMRVGAHWKIFVPPELAYGERGAGKMIGPNQTLIFDVELLSIK